MWILRNDNFLGNTWFHIQKFWVIKSKYFVASALSQTFNKYSEANLSYSNERKVIFHSTKLQRNRYGESVFREKKQVKDFTEIIQEEIGKDHKSLAEVVRKKLYYKNLEPLNVVIWIR